MGRVITPPLDRAANDVFQGEHLPDAGRTVSAEMALWQSAIAQAWADAFLASDSALNNTDRTVLPGAIRGEARRWLTWPEHKEDRQTVCDLAGIDEPKLRRAARAKLAEGANRKPAVIGLDAMFARLLERETELSPEALDTALSELAALESSAA